MQIRFFGLLGLAFIVLKLMKVINWPWIWILVPLWGGCAFLFIVTILVAIIVGLDSLSQKK